MGGALYERVFVRQLISIANNDKALGGGGIGFMHNAQIQKYRLRRKNEGQTEVLVPAGDGGNEY